VWNLATLKDPLKNSLLSASASALKLSLHYPKEVISYENQYNKTNRATPFMFSKYKLGLKLLKT
jgi:hypothetical protein